MVVVVGVVDDVDAATVEVVSSGVVVVAAIGTVDVLRDVAGPASELEEQPETTTRMAAPKSEATAERVFNADRMGAN